MKYNILSFLFAANLAQAMPDAQSTTFNLTPKNGKVQFEAVGRPAMVKIKGHGEGAQGKLSVQANKISGDLKFALASLDTGIDMRNEHMKDKYLEVKNHPEARLVLNEVTLPDGWSLANPKVSESVFAGTLELHGVKKDISGTFSISEKKSAEAKFEIKISDYKIDIPSYLGVTVADTVKVKVLVDEISN